MVQKKNWDDFQKSGLLWWVNTLLHTFGWALVAEMEDGKITQVYPARVKFRGFSEETNTKGYQNISQYLKESAIELEQEAND